jgi:hypothetical protein
MRTKRFLFSGHEANYDPSENREEKMKTYLSGSGKRAGTRMFRGLIVFLATISLGFASPVISGDIQVVKGVVERISGKYIVLSGERYDVTGVPVEGHPGKKRSRAVIRGGDKVELSLQGGKVISLRNFGPVLQ